MPTPSPTPPPPAARPPAAGRARRLVPELAPGRAVGLRADDQRLVRGKALGGAPQALADRLAEERDLARAVRVGAEGSRGRGHGHHPARLSATPAAEA